MKNEKICLSLIFLLCFFGPGCLATSQPALEGTSQQMLLETYLREAKVVDVKKDGPGRTAGWIVTLDDGKTKQRGFFKYVNDQRPSPIPDSYRYELAAYELTKLLGIEIVPPVVEREIEGLKGSLQIFLENCIKEKDRRRKNLEPADPKAFADALEEVKVFEILAADECLDIDDTLVHQDSWKVCRIDFSEAFFPSAELLPECEITRCSKKLHRGLFELKDEAIRSTLKVFLNDEEIGALLKRRTLITEKIGTLIKEKGEEAVLF